MNIMSVFPYAQLVSFVSCVQLQEAEKSHERETGELAYDT